MSEPVYRTLKFTVQVNAVASAECINLLSQVMSATYRDLPASDQWAVAAWFQEQYGKDE